MCALRLKSKGNSLDLADQGLLGVKGEELVQNSWSLVNQFEFCLALLRVFSASFVSRGEGIILAVILL